MGYALTQYGEPKMLGGCRCAFDFLGRQMGHSPLTVGVPSATNPGTDSASRVVSGESSFVHPRAILGRRNATEVAGG